MDTLSRSGRVGRVVATVVGVSLLMAGTVRGSDDDFPFGPFRMYAGVNGPNEDAPDPRVDGTDAAGVIVSLGQDATGMRRAEVESKQDRYVADPALLIEPRRWRELEVELVDGPPEVLDAVDAALRAAGARPARAASKLAQALGDGYPDPDGGLRRYGAAQRALWTYLWAQRNAIVDNDPGVRDGDPEAVHRMRVATRRLRSTLRSFAPLLTGDLDRLHDEVKCLTGVLGEVRDGDVMGERLALAVAAEPPELIIGPVSARIRQHLAKQTAEARTRLVAALDSPRYAALIGAIEDFADAPPTSRIKRTEPYRLVRRALRRADRLLAEADRPDPPDTTTGIATPPGYVNRDERLHEARKAYKRARYAVELVGPLAGKPARRLASGITELQDVLGVHQDSIGTGHLLRRYGIGAHLAGENAFSYGLLHARLHHAGIESLERVPAARNRISTRRARFWLT